MSQNSAMGKDPLDWVGKGPNGVPQNGHGPVGANGKARPEPGAQPPYAESQITAALSAASESSPDTALEMTRKRGPSLEREILLMRGLPREGLLHTRESTRAMRWFVAALIVAVLGIGALYFVDSRRRWSEHVETLEGRIRANDWSLRQSVDRADELVRSKESIIRSKDEAIRDRERLLREKERVIEVLQASREARLDFAPVLAKLREIGERLGRALGLPPAGGIVGRAREGEDKSASPFRPVPAIPGLEDR